MPSALASVSTPTSKSLKWTTQRIKSGRVHKRTTSSASSLSSRSPLPSHTKKPASHQDAIRQLESELTFTYDTFATVNVMFDSLQNAYSSSKYEMDQYRNETRLNDKEKELLAAYDDLGLQVSHLEREVIKLEKRLEELRSSAPAIQTPSPAISPVVALASPVMSSSASPYLSYPEYPFISSEYLYENQELYCGYQQQQLQQQQNYLISNPFFDPTLVFDPYAAGYYFSNANIVPF